MLMSSYVYTYSTIVSKAKAIKKNVETKYKLSETSKWSYYMAKAILSPKKDIKKIKFTTAKNSNGDNFGRQIYKSDYLDMAKRFTAYVENHNQLPNSIKVKDMKMRVSDYTYMFSRILVYYHNHGQLPKYANVNSKAFTKPTESGDEIYDYFVRTFGKVTCIDDALEKIAGRGYGYYYDDVYSNRQSIDRMKNGQGINCTDSTAVFYNIGKTLGYEVRAVHVKCRGGDGHIRLQLKHSKRTNGNWINRDPAAVLDSGVITKVWCLDGTVLAYQPQWFLQNVNR